VRSAGALFVLSSLNPGFELLDNVVQALGQIVSVAGHCLSLGSWGFIFLTVTVAGHAKGDREPTITQSAGTPVVVGS
jgi:hypothetical protein